MILGIDEAGRGPWAGPLVVGAVVLGCEIDGLNDSKKLSKKTRDRLEIEILQRAQAVGLGWVSANELDEVGMSQALELATKRAVSSINAPYHEIIIDGTVNFLKNTAKGQYVTTLPKADSLVPAVSAASIVAKVARDRYMTELDDNHPEYGFKSHVGYGVAKHREAIDKFGVINEHRLSFAPLKKYAHKTEIPDDHPPAKVKSITTTRQIGNRSETVATDELVRLGHKILERNWRTKYCEIDIVSMYRKTIYFTEVKHRKNAKSGDGLQAITATKLKQMKFASKFYIHTNHLEDADVILQAIATTGENPVVTQLVVIDS